MGRKKKKGEDDEDARAGEEFDERKLLESSSESGQDYDSDEASFEEQEIDSDSELSGDEAVQRLKQLEWEYRKSMMHNNPSSYRTTHKTPIKHFAEADRIIRTRNRDMNRDIKILGTGQIKAKVTKIN